jgi:hypothetical protein
MFGVGFGAGSQEIRSRAAGEDHSLAATELFPGFLASGSRNSAASGLGVFVVNSGRPRYSPYFAIAGSLERPAAASRFNLRACAVKRSMYT